MVDTLKPPRTEDKRELRIWQQEISVAVNKKKAAARVDSTAADLAALIVDFNDLLAKLRTADLLSS